MDVVSIFHIDTLTSFLIDVVTFFLIAWITVWILKLQSKSFIGILYGMASP